MSGSDSSATETAGLGSLPSWLLALGALLGGLVLAGLSLLLAWSCAEFGSSLSLLVRGGILTVALTVFVLVGGYSLGFVTENFLLGLPFLIAVVLGLFFPSVWWLQVVPALFFVVVSACVAALEFKGPTRV
jgi:hypothetical protein